MHAGLVRHWARLILCSLAAALLVQIPMAYGQPAGEMNVALHFTMSPTWFDPAETPGIITPFLMLYAIHDALVKPMPEGPMTPSLAESWTMSEDGRIYEFRLRQGLTFHNGDPFTAEDVKFSFQRYKGSGAKEMQGRVQDVEIVDPHRVRFHLKDPWPDFMTFYGTPATGAAWIVSKKYLEQVGDEGFKRHPIGLGPYKFVSSQPGVDLVVEAYDKHWRKVPHVKKITFRSVPEDSTRIAMLKRGEADIAYGIFGALAEEVQADKRLKLVATVLDCPFWLDFTEQWDPKSPWADTRVRLAANYALDRKAISEAESLGHAPASGSIIPMNNEFAVKFEPYPYDPKKAMQLLKEAGYAQGFDSGEIFANPPYGGLAEAVANYFTAVGIRSKVRVVERSAYYAGIRELKWRGVLVLGSCAYGNAATRIDAFVVSGRPGVYGGYPDIDEMARQQAVELDRAKREAILADIQRLMHERVMHGPIWELAFLNGVGARVEVSGFGLIRAFTYTAPYEDIRLKP
jgi:peptide/nickel transport system substrate-binding protein